MKTERLPWRKIRIFIPYSDNWLVDLMYRIIHIHICRISNLTKLNGQQMNPSNHIFHSVYNISQLARRCSRVKTYKDVRVSLPIKEIKNFKPNRRIWFRPKPSRSGCWSRRSSLEKKLTVVSILAALVAVGFLIGLIVVAVNNNKSSEDGIESLCLTQECIAEASVVLRQMNQSADPYV